MIQRRHKLETQEALELVGEFLKHQGAEPFCFQILKAGNPNIPLSNTLKNKDVLWAGHPAHRVDALLGVQKGWLITKSHFWEWWINSTTDLLVDVA